MQSLRSLSSQPPALRGIRVKDILPKRVDRPVWTWRIRDSNGDDAAHIILLQIRDEKTDARRVWIPFAEARRLRFEIVECRRERGSHVFVFVLGREERRDGAYFGFDDDEGGRSVRGRSRARVDRQSDVQEIS